MLHPAEEDAEGHFESIFITYSIIFALWLSLSVCEGAAVLITAASTVICKVTVQHRNRMEATRSWVSSLVSRTNGTFGIKESVYF